MVGVSLPFSFQSLAGTGKLISRIQQILLVIILHPDCYYSV